MQHTQVYATKINELAMVTTRRRSRRSSVLVGVEVDEDPGLLDLHDALVRLLGRVRLRHRDALLEEDSLVVKAAAAERVGLLLPPR